jgi:multicomponent Na+:H+ antiporter subunit D
MVYLLLFIPFLALIVFNLFPKRLRGAAAFHVCLIVFLLQMIFSALAPFGSWEKAVSLPLEKLFEFNLYLNNAGCVLLFSAALAAASALILSLSTIEHEDCRFDFANLLMIALIGINGIALSTDIFTLYVFIEVTALASFILIGLFRQNEAYEGLFKYLMLSVVASVLMLTGLALFLIAASDTSYQAIQAAMLAQKISFVPLAAMALFISGLFIKAGMVPFHGWLPDAYSTAPAPVSAFLAGIVTKASGLYALIRLSSGVFGLTPELKTVFLVTGTLSILIGALGALWQKDLKRLLAYSSISQMGYILLGLGAGSLLGIYGALFHFLNHAILKSQLFANAAAIETTCRTREIEHLGGLAEKMPVTAATSMIGLLSTAGLPPLSGFWSKFMIILALYLAGQYAFAAIGLLAGVMTLGYFLILQRRVFFGELPTRLTGVKEEGWGMLIPPVALSLLTIGLGLAFPFIYKAFIR